LDKFVEGTLIPEYNKGKKKKQTKEAGRLYQRICQLRKKGASEENLKPLRKELLTVTISDPYDPDYRRLRYIRYADDFLLGFAGPKNEAEEIRQSLSEFLEQRLKLTLSKEKTLITHANDERAKFLGYEIKVTRCGHLISEDDKRATNGYIALLMPRKVVQKYRSLYSKKGKVQHRTELLPETDYTIVQRYQSVLKGLYNYYCMAVNVSKQMGYIKWVLETSLTKTLASKFRCKVSEIYKRYQVTWLDRKELRVTIERPNKEPLIAVFGGFAFERNPEGLGAVDFRFETAWFLPSGKRSEVVQRLLFGKCELCGEEDEPVAVHHIRQLRDIDRPGRRPKANWEKIMAARRRKTLVVCGRCHWAIHEGVYDGPAL